MKNLIPTTVLTLVALGSAMLIYHFFPGNVASVSTAGQLMKFGGPIAAFIGTFLILAHFYNRQATKSSQLPVLVREKVRPLAGVWTINAESDGPTAAVRISTTQIIAGENGIELTGGSFNEPEAGGQAGQMTGQWNCQVAMFNGHRLLYVYELHETRQHKGRHRGVVDAQLVAGSKPPCFNGTWETIGGNAHAGRIILTKQED